MKSPWFSGFINCTSDKATNLYKLFDKDKFEKNIEKKTGVT